MARPWRSSAPAVVVAADAAPAAGTPAKKKKRRRGRGAAGAGDEGEEGAGDVPAVVIPASDRAMSWRGPAITAPTRSMDMGSSAEDRPLSNDEIDRTMNDSSGPVLDCIRSALAGGELSGEVRLEMLVDPGGAVKKVRIGAPKWLMDHGFADCASAAARRLRFPATGAHTVVKAPFHID